MSGAWKYPPRKDHKAERRREALSFALWITVAAIVALWVGSMLTKAIAQAAHDAVHYESCVLEGC